MISQYLFKAALAASVTLTVCGANPDAAQTLGKIPMYFEPNVGQTDGPVRFVARSRGATVYFTDTDVVLAMHRRQAGDDKGAKTQRASIRMKMTGGRSALEAKGLDPQPGLSNYFIGDDPAKWHAVVQHFGKIALTSVYDGIDLVSYGNENQLEYDFVVAPGADPAQVQLAFEGASSLTVNSDGDLVMKTAIGDVIQRRPKIYQDTPNGRVTVAANYRLFRKNRVTFELASYDRSQALVIDPVIVFSTYLGGSSYDCAYGIAVDTEGSAYITGYTDSNDFPHASGQTRSSDDAFVTKLSVGGQLQYSTFVGGSQNDRAFSIAVDQAGEAYIAGDTDSTNLPMKTNSFNQGTWDGFVTKLSGSGNVVFSTYVGGSGEDKALAIAVDSANSAYITGYSTSPGLKGGVGGYNAAVNNGGQDAFAAKISSTGAISYQTFLGGSSNDQGLGIAVDASGSAYVTGYTGSSHFPPVNAYQPCNASSNTNDAFVTKLNPQGTALVYSTCLGGTAEDQGLAIAVDASGSAYGYTQSFQDFPVVGGIQGHPSVSSDDAFVAKLSPSGSSLIYSTYLGGGGTDIARGIAVDSAGNAYVVGETTSTSLTNTQITNAGLADAFMASLNPAGNGLNYLITQGDTATDVAYAVAVDVLGSAYVAGYTESPHFPTTSRAYQANSVGPAAEGNGFVTKIAGILTPQGAKINPLT